MTRASNIRYSFKTTVAPSAHILEGSCVPDHKQEKYEYVLNSVKQSHCILCSTFNNPLHSCCCLQALNRPSVTTPSHTRQALSHKTRAHLHRGASGRNPLCANCHRTGFSSSEMLQLSLLTLQVGKMFVSRTCQLEGSLEGCTYGPNCSVSLPSYSQRHKLGHCESHSSF